MESEKFHSTSNGTITFSCDEKGNTSYTFTPANVNNCDQLFGGGATAEKVVPKIKLFKNQFLKMLNLLNTFMMSIYPPEGIPSEEINATFADIDNKVLMSGEISEYGTTTYIPIKIILEASIFKGKLRFWLQRQWFKRPEYSEETNVEPGAIFPNIQLENVDGQWIAGHGSYGFEPNVNELRAIATFFKQVNVGDKKPFGA